MKNKSKFKASNFSKKRLEEIRRAKRTPEEVVKDLNLDFALSHSDIMTKILKGEDISSHHKNLILGDNSSSLNREEIEN